MFNVPIFDGKPDIDSICSYIQRLLNVPDEAMSRRDARGNSTYEKLQEAVAALVYHSDGTDSP